jgi:hypothetical protein
METEAGRGDLAAADARGMQTGLATCPNQAGPHLPFLEENVYFSAFSRLPDRLNQVRGRTKPMSKLRPHRMDTLMIKDDKSLDSYWDLEIQDTLLDVAAAIAATELAGASVPVGQPAPQSALVAHWLVCQPTTLNRIN